MSLLNRFRGSLIGGLLGDCLGSPFEGEPVVALKLVNSYFAQLFDPNVKVPYKPYTDDSALTKCVALSLIEHRGYNAEDMAKKMAVEYFSNPNRGYGANVGEVFMGLRNSRFENPYGPAQNQFGGRGSYGNGSAMRIAPIALFAHSDPSSLIELATKSSQITHAHIIGIRGGILQAIGILQALKTQSNPSGEFDVTTFADGVIAKMGEVEKKEEDPLDEVQGHYSDKLNIVKQFLASPEFPSVAEIQEKLGNSVSAYNSVPTALFCFLASQKPIPGIDCENKFLRGIELAISLGGDTDTIGSMCGALGGAYYGIDSIPKDLLRHCEKVELFDKLALDLHSISGGMENKKADAS